MLVNLAGSEYLTNKDLAARWNLSRRATIRRRQRLGLLPDEFLGLMPLFLPEKVEAADAAERARRMVNYLPLASTPETASRARARR